MPFALELSDHVDPTALATFLLAALTFATVVVGGLALRRTRSEIDLSRREVEEAHRPVLVPVNDENQELREFDAPTVYRAKPRYKETTRVVVPIKNIGAGPALNITVFVAPADWSDGPTQVDDLHWFTTRLLGLGVSEIAAVTVYVPELAGLSDFALALTYVDVAGKTWRTAADYSAREGGEYVGMSLEAMPLKAAEADSQGDVA